MNAPLTPVLPAVRLLSGNALRHRMPALTQFAMTGATRALSRHPLWLAVFREAFGHTPLALEATDGGRTVGYLPLVFMRSSLFGRFLVSLPYLNTAGVVCESPRAGTALMRAAVQVAREFRVRHLELRHETPLEDAAYPVTVSQKVHLRLPLPDFPGPLWESLKPAVRNLVRKGEKHSLRCDWGRHELLDAFYRVFATNMRDLGTPVYARKFFATILKTFPHHAELCVVRLGDQPVAAALLLHGRGVTEIPSASSLRAFNHTSANMLMYWKVLERCIERGQNLFDFGRSWRDSGTYKFKRQWGAHEEPAHWQYHLRGGQAGAMRPDNPKYQRLIAAWQRLPVWLTRTIGPPIVRGIP